MRVETLDIEDGVYGTELLSYLWRKKSGPNVDLQLLALLQKLCRTDLVNEPDLKSDLFSEVEKEILLSTKILNVCNNKEIKARWCDYVQALDKQKLPTYLKQSALYYLEVHTATGGLPICGSGTTTGTQSKRIVRE